jgi:hypothetical protein
VQEYSAPLLGTCGDMSFSVVPQRQFWLRSPSRCCCAQQQHGAPCKEKEYRRDSVLWRMSGIFFGLYIGRRRPTDITLCPVLITMSRCESFLPVILPIPLTGSNLIYPNCQTDFAANTYSDFNEYGGCERSNPAVAFFAIGEFIKQSAPS